MPAKKLLRAVAGLSALAAATVFAWWAWLGRDTEMQLDPATGNYSGPYTTAQVAGLVLTLAALLIVAVLLRVPALPAAAVMTVAFTAAWTVQASEDETGLFLVGMILVLGGMAIGTTVVALLTAALRRKRSA
jgi:hypothetical protein